MSVTSMPHAVVISIGDELLSGRTQDTNAFYLSKELRAVGFPVKHRETCPDDADRIAECLRRAASHATVIVMTGGMGPTDDDLTRHGIAKGLGSPLERCAEAEEQVRAIFRRAGRRMPEANLIQADLPVGTSPIPNAWGTAPGIHATWDNGCELFVLPGVPVELRNMVEQTIKPRLLERTDRGTAPQRRALTVCGIPESRLGEHLDELMARGRDPILGSYPRVSSFVLQLETRRQGAEAKRVLDRDVAEIRKRLGKAVVGDGELQVHEVVAQQLMDRGETLAVAESLTAGLVSDLIAQTPGVSRILLGGVAAYHNDVKCNLLGVERAVLDSYGAVSEQCAAQMAMGIRSRLSSHWGLSTTGIAGPTGGSSEKPVGTVYLGMSSPQGVKTRRLNLVGDRQQIRERAATALLDWLRREMA